MIELLLIINYIVFCVTTANFVIGLTHLDTINSVFLVINLLLAVITAICVHPYTANGNLDWYEFLKKNPKIK